MISFKTACLSGLLLFFVLRLSGIQFGLPYDGIHPTEHFTIEQSLYYSSSSDWKPYDFQHPTLYQYCITIIGKALKLGSDYHPLWYLLGRIISCLSSLSAVIVLYFLGKRLCASRIGGLVCASVMGLNMVSVQYAHYAVPDSLCSFFVLASMFSALLILERPVSRNFILCGIACGLSVGSKFTGLISLGFLLTAGILSYRQHPCRSLVRLGSGLCAAGVVFFTVSPYHVFHFSEFIRDAGVYLHDKGYTSPFHLFTAGYWVYPMQLLPAGAGIVTYICALFGLVIMARRNKTQILMILLPLLFYYLYIGKEKGGTLQNIIPFIPVFGLGLASFFLYLWGIQRAKPYGLFVLFVALSLSLVKSLAFDGLLYQPDTRVQAQEWMLKNIPQQSKIAYERYSPIDMGYLTLPEARTQFNTYEFIPSVSVHPAEYYVSEKFDYVITTGFREASASFFCDTEKYCSAAQHYASLKKQYAVKAVFNPHFLAAISALPAPWGSWPHHPRISVYSVAD